MATRAPNTLRSVIKTWNVAEAYPLIAVVTGAACMGAGILARNALYHDDITLNKRKPFPFMRVADPRTQDSGSS